MIPLIPESLLMFLDAPVPFLIGISGTYSQYKEIIKKYDNSHIIFISLDDDLINSKTELNNSVFKVVQKNIKKHMDIIHKKNKFVISIGKKIMLYSK